MAAVDDSAACHVDNSHNYATHRYSAWSCIEWRIEFKSIYFKRFQMLWFKLIELKKKLFFGAFILILIFLITKWVFFTMSTAFIHCSVRVCLGLTWWNSIGLFIQFVIYLHLDSSDKRPLIALGVRLWHHKSVKSVFIHTHTNNHTRDVIKKELFFPFDMRRLEVQTNEIAKRKYVISSNLSVCQISRMK